MTRPAGPRRTRRSRATKPIAAPPAAAGSPGAAAAAGAGPKPKAAKSAATGRRDRKAVNPPPDPLQEHDERERLRDRLRRKFHSAS
jgi:hypothetical protein